MSDLLGWSGNRQGTAGLDVPTLDPIGDAPALEILNRATYYRDSLITRRNASTLSRFDGFPNGNKKSEHSMRLGLSEIKIRLQT